MPTFGWIREDDMDAFFESATKVPDPTKLQPKFNCPFCARIFNDKLNLQRHITKTHRVERPILLIDGREPPSQTTIRTSIPATGVSFANVTSVEFIKNGKSAKITNIKQLPNLISSCIDDEINLIMQNTTQLNASPAKSSYKLSIKIADQATLTSVENAFITCLVKQPISMDRINLFLSDNSCKGIGEEYAKGLGDYALGIILKERPLGEHLTTPFSRYREKYGSALDILSDYKRPMANLVCDIIRFALNSFEQTTKHSGFWNLDFANAILSDPHCDVLLNSSIKVEKQHPVCPIDHGSSIILDLTAFLGRQSRWGRILEEECWQVANSKTISSEDKNKAFAVWAATACRLGANGMAREPLRNISAIYPFDQWANDYLEQSDK